MVSRRYITAGLFVALAAIWGSSFVATRVALSEFTPILLAAFRFDIAAVIMTSYAAATTPRWIPTTHREWSTVIIGGVLFIAVHHAFLFAGQQYVTSAVAAVVICLDPILAAVFGRVLLPEERLSRIGLIGLGFGVLGVSIIADLSSNVLRGTETIGILLVFVSAAAFAFGAVITRRRRTDLSIQSMQAWMMIIGAVVLHGIAFLSPKETIAALSWSWSALAGLVYLAVIAAGVGYFLYFELLSRVGAIELNLVAYATPVFAAPSGWLVLGEQVHIQTLAGFISIVIGFVLVKRHALKTEVSKLRNQVTKQ